MNNTAVLCLNSWAGYNERPCCVIGETPKRYRITVDVRTKGAGRNRWFLPGVPYLVPKSAVKFTNQPSRPHTDKGEGE